LYVPSGFKQAPAVFWVFNVFIVASSYQNQVFFAVKAFSMETESISKLSLDS
jgi:hypothetical protein